ncbi:MAG TPA: sn-glycerol-1-phosphate dehydrogenase [Treponemataceae bacterium]|nr:sn-glycerol-1-phosphate dehydrogenase [Treponemataceae bacterium]
MKTSEYTKVPSINECLNIATDTEEMIVRLGAIKELGPILVRMFPDVCTFLIADETTLNVADAQGELTTSLSISSVEILGITIFPAKPTLHADYKYVKALAADLKEKKVQAEKKGKTLVPIAIGGGTINDLTKRAAFEAGLLYFCVPTAASVDGYTSYGAALLSNGFKKTFECPAPRAVIADSSILSCAPAYLSSSGFGDLAGKIIAGTDWLIAETAGSGGALGTEPINPLAWAMTQTGLRSALSRSQEASKGNVQAIEILFEALALTGFSMQYLKSSRPVSGCEHLFSHVWEMANLSMNGIPVTHGHKVAIGTLCATAITEQFFSHVEAPKWIENSKSRETVVREAEVRAAFLGQNAADDAVKTALDKLLDEKRAKALKEHISDEWGTLRIKVLNQLMPYNELRTMFKTAGCPITAEEIGLKRCEAIKTAYKAQMIRNRYTVLDLIWDYGLMETVLESVEADKNYLT